MEDTRTHKREYKIHVPDKFLEKFGLHTTEKSELIMGKDAFSRMMSLLDLWTLHQAAKEEYAEFDKFCKEYKYE
jgi:hypothetical protein